MANAANAAISSTISATSRRFEAGLSSAGPVVGAAVYRRRAAWWLMMLVCCFTLTSQSHADISKIRNFYRFSEQVLSSGQPKQAELESASGDGIEVVINIVPATESIYNPNEAETLLKQGIEYIHTPVNWSNPKDAEIKAFLRAMDKVGDRKVLVHCWANARASALVHIHQMIRSAENQTTELENLKKVWSDVAGYSLDNNSTWLHVIKKYAVEAE